MYTEVFQQNYVKISIIDNGVRISKEIKQRLFDPVFTTKLINKGSEMGLFISYQIVTQKHGGSLECFSIPTGVAPACDRCSASPIKSH
ncbi:ATP-binding protein [Scytonema hofmannii]|uniref:ATP-binding protein n=1 Tax=Scytonema hofmannii TaxID=34078 RepID=UPI00234F217A|nr:ATP-binding protein [Scytonema hofmannii]